MSYHSLPPSVPSLCTSSPTPNCSRSNSNMKNAWQTHCRMTFLWKVHSLSLTTSSPTLSTCPCRPQVARSVPRALKRGTRRPSAPLTRPCLCPLSSSTTLDSSQLAFCFGYFGSSKRMKALWKCQNQWASTHGSYSWTQVFRQKI